MRDSKMRLVNFIPISFFEWCDETVVAEWVRSGWNFGAIQSFHLMVLAALIGTTLAVDLHVLGLGTRRSTDRVVRELSPWIWIALTLMVLSGSLLFVSQPMRIARSSPFFVKMILLCSAIFVQILVHRSVFKPPTTGRAAFHKISACMALLCWLGVAYSGRAIAFSQLLPFLPRR